MKYQIEQRSGYRLYYEETDRAVAEQACRALERALSCNRQQWGFESPRDLHMVIMTGWWSYITAAAPPGAKAALALSYPLWAGRIRRTWKFTGGWQNRYGRRFVIGIKPPRLIAAADRSLGRRIYLDVEDLDEKMRQVVYHEVTHACAAHLRLPAWLNEGLAMLTTDILAGMQTVQPGTLELLGGGIPFSGGRRLASLNPDAIAALYARGYWITRYLSEARPALLLELLKRPLGRGMIESRLAEALNLPHERLWADIEMLVREHYSRAA